MTPSTSLPVLSGQSTTTPNLWEVGTSDKKLPAVEHLRTQGSILHRNPYGNKSDIKAIHHVSGCAHLCGFCATRPHIGADGLSIRLTVNAAEQLAAEVANRLHRPQAVYVCPHTDPFPPYLEVQQETGRVVEVLAAHEIEAWILTRGYIRPFAQDVLVRCRDRVKVMVGITTLNRALQRVVEPLSAPPRLRLKQIKRLRSLGVPVQAALEPLIPGLTDTRDNLLELLEALAEAGVRRITAGYLFLPNGAAERLQQQLQPHGWDALVLDAFADGFQTRHGEQGWVRYLNKSRRQQGYALLMALAAPFGITVSISSLCNPDFAKPEPPRVFSQGYLPGLGTLNRVSAS